jgi:hypothetical protein
VTIIGKNAFCGCDDLESVDFGKNSQITKIDKYVFQNCTSLTGITIPDSVKTIDDGAFYGCTSLASVSIPNNVTIIGDYAFWGDVSLKRIDFGGEKAAWNAINKGTYWHYGTISVTVYCTDGNITEK